MPEVPDLLIVGGGPAGLATAIRARRKGLTVTVLERGRAGRDKPCGEGLMPDAVKRLAELGVAAETLGVPFKGIRYVDQESGTLAEGHFPGGVSGRGVRRTQLHRALAQRAREVGVNIRWGSVVQGLADGWQQASTPAVRTSQGNFAGRWLVAADGLRSSLRKQAGLLAPQRSARPGETASRFGVRRHFRQAPWTNLVEVHWGPQCEAYVTPVGTQEVGVAMLWSGGKATFDDLLERLPRLEDRLRHAFATSRDRGSGPLKQRARAVYRGRLALVGDAAGYLDAITGEGLALALHQAFALVEAVLKGDLKRYQRACRRVTRLPNLITAGVLAAERRPWLRRRLVRTLAAEPLLFDRLLGVHAGSLKLKELGLGGMLRLARGLVVAHGT